MEPLRIGDHHVAAIAAAGERWLLRDHVARVLDYRTRESLDRTVIGAQLPARWAGQVQGQDAITLKGVRALCYHLEFVSRGRSLNRVRSLLAALDAAA